MTDDSRHSRRRFLKKIGSVLGVSAVSGLAVASAGNKNAQIGSNAREISEDSKTVTIEPVDNQMEYATTEIRAEAGSELTIVMNNTATSPAMHHNVVILEDEEDVEETVGMAAMQAKDNDFIPPEHDDVIIAHTPMAEPGEETEVTFTVPPAGEYPYICTYPGHWQTMQGTLISEA